MTGTSKPKLVFISLFLIISSSLQGAKLQEEKELEVINFNNVKNVLEQDGLLQAANRKKKEASILQKKKQSIEKSKYFYPNQDELWGFISEYWLIKNAQLLSWDFEQANYGLEKSYRDILEKFGFYQKKFKILLVNSTAVVRTALPGSGNEVIYVLSIPFIRSLDLSKLEISLLLMEDFFRYEAGYFKKAVETEKMRNLAATNFKGSKADLSMIEELLKNYNRQINEKGFSFQQQFEVTKKMDAQLKSNPELWNTYYRLLGKIDRFIKSNVQYKQYINLYPSPEMQMKWLSPEEKVL
jgi:hypothetical protein